LASTRNMADNDDEDVGSETSSMPRAAYNTTYLYYLSMHSVTGFENQLYAHSMLQ